LAVADLFKIDSSTPSGGACELKRPKAQAWFAGCHAATLNPAGLQRKLASDRIALTIEAAAGRYR